MPKIETMHDLMIHQLSDLYSAEKQLVEALPKMVKGANSEELQSALSAHLDETTEQVSRLERVFELLGVKAERMKCKGMEGLIVEWVELLC